MTAYVPAKPKLPTSRTLAKSGRDFGLAIIGFCVAYTVAHQADLGLDPEVAGIVPALVQLGYRWLRGLVGAEPE